MREEEEEEPNWFARWDEELPSPDELTPLTQTLITPDIAFAFDIPSSSSASLHHRRTPLLSQSRHLHAAAPTPSSQAQHLQQPDFDSPSTAAAASGGGLSGDDLQARPLKRPRLVWTPQLHKRFIDAVAHLGIKNAVPKTIMQLMSVDGLTRENVASHLQKYRLYLKRMQGFSGSAGGGGGAALALAGGVGGPDPQSDPAMDQLFANGPLPHNFLSRGVAEEGVGPDQFLPFMQVSALQQQIAAAAARQQQNYHPRHMEHLGSPIEDGYLSRQPQQLVGIHRMVGGNGVGMVAPATPRPVPDRLVDSNPGDIRRRVLTLFPTNDD